jgi:hypothetical protein
LVRPKQADALRLLIQKELHWNACVPEYLESSDLDVDPAL